jgi:flagellar hook-basal body complex protein FliE
MPVNFSAAVNAYANAGRIGAAPATGASEGGDSFSDLLRRAADGAIDSLKKGEEATMQAVTGKADLTQVTEAVNNAQVTLQTVVAIRDKVVQAYQAIMQMPI